MPRAVYLTRSGLPEDAPGIHTYHVAGLFAALSYEVDFLCDRLGDTPAVHVGGFRYFFRRNRGSSLWVNLGYAFQRLTGWAYFRKVRRYLDRERPDVVILYNATYGLTRRVLRACHRRGIAAIGDVTEWYERGYGRWDRRFVAWSADRRIRRLDVRLDGVLAISPFLDAYYRMLGVPSLFLPPIFPVDAGLAVSPRGETPFVPRLFYAGAPGGKDLLRPALFAVRRMAEAGTPVRFDLAGVDAGYVAGLMGEPEERLGALGITAHGRLPHPAVLALLAQMDYAVLLRPCRRFAQAGFSTKFAESMANGVAMLCNRVGGADSVLCSGVDGIVLDSPEEEAVLAALKEIVQNGEAWTVALRRRAHVRAVSLFDADGYLQALGGLIARARKEASGGKA